MNFYGPFGAMCDDMSDPLDRTCVAASTANSPERYLKMSDIVLSAGVRSNLLQLQQTSDLITQTQDRLSTGKKVNSALDNAINFFTAQGFTTRTNDLNGLLDSMTNGVNTIQAANNGITAITKLVQSAQSLVSQAQ